MNRAFDIVLHIPSLGGGGAERVAVDLAREFAGRGLSVVVFVHDAAAAYALPEGVTLHVAGARHHMTRVAEFRRLLRRARPRAVISLLPYANLITLLAARFAQTDSRIVVSEHIPAEHKASTRWRDRLKFALLTRLYPRADAIVAVSKGIAEELQARLGPAVGGKVSVIYNPCYLQAARPSCGLGDRVTPVVLAAGRLVPQKGFDTLIKAFSVVRSIMPGARLIIAGEGAERAALEQCIDTLNLGGHVTLPGFVDDMTTLYRAARLFVCSSRIEGFGNVIVEAMSFGLPVVATDCRYGPREILAGGRYGDLVPVDDESALALAILKALGRPANPQWIIERASDFAIDAIGQRYLDVSGIQ